MGFWNNVRSSIDDKSSMSVSGISLLVATFTGGILALIMGFAICYDVMTNGFVKTSLIDAGIFVLCCGTYIAGSGLPKTIIDSRVKPRIQTITSSSETTSTTTETTTQQ
jgi:hypothetical protein